MVCVQQANQNNSNIVVETIEDSDSEGFVIDPTMSDTGTSLLGISGQPLEFRHLAGFNLVRYPPIYSSFGNCIFFRDETAIHVYNTKTGEKVRSLSGSDSKLISMEFELEEAGTLVSCTEDGTVLYWDWDSGKLKTSIKLSFPLKGKVLNFNLLYIYDNSKTACAFVFYKQDNGEFTWYLMNTTTGKPIRVSKEIPFGQMEAMIAVDNRNFHYLAVVQGNAIYFVDYRTWRWRRLKNARGIFMTTVAVHPSEACVATGDQWGQIFLWRDFYNFNHLQNTVLYHWHHTPVTSIAFTESGTSFYSSGYEGVLVRWNVENPLLRQYLPRLNSYTVHIAVQSGNTQIALSTADNGVHFLDADNNIKSTLQDFTFSPDDKTGLDRFPIGLQRNPRFNTLVLNGRVGHLQFYSAYSKNLLYNLNIVNQNALSMEAAKILYNIRVTKAAFNIEWMATGEVFNDQQHIPELRLKFWKFQEKDQCYELNTNIEMPHERGFRAIEFSNSYQVDNLRCATVGEDNLIRLWALNNTDNIYRIGAKVWSLVAQASYNNMPIQSINFSIDGSILAAGFGNTLCLYTTDNMKLKVALSSPFGFDGVAQKVRVHMPSSSEKSDDEDTNSHIETKQKSFLKLFTTVLEKNDEKHLEKLVEMLKDDNDKTKIALKISGKHKVLLFKKIVQMNTLSALQKLQIIQKLEIPCDFEPVVKEKISEHIKKNLEAKSLYTEYEKLHSSIWRLDRKSRFKAKYRLKQQFRHMLAYDAEVTQAFNKILNIVGLEEAPKQAKKNNQKSESSEQGQEHPPNYRLLIDDLPPPAEITHIQFASGEHAHVVVVCTKSRVLVWNLLTLRLKFFLKIATKHLAYDPITNLIAIVSHQNELHIFEPHMPVPVYRRKNIPDVIGLSWLPRRKPKSTSIYLNWQSQSILYFLTSDQAIKYLAPPSSRDHDDDGDHAPVVAFKNPANSIQYTTFGTYATKQHSDKDSLRNKNSGPLLVGDSSKSAARMLTEMSCHTMPPLSLLAGEFINALAKPTRSTDDDKPLGSMKLTNGDTSSAYNGEASESESEQIDETQRIRKEILSKSEELSKNTKTKESNSEERLKKLAKKLSKIDLQL